MKKLLSFMLTAAMLLAVMPGLTVYGADIVDRGNCGDNGDNLTWTLDSKGTLTISGSGDMRDYPYWNGHDGDIITVIIEPGTRTIGHAAFENCTDLTSVSIPDSVTDIGEFAFSGCSGLASVSIPDSVTTIGFGAFKNCTGLTSVSIPNSVVTIEAMAFENCTGLTSVSIPDGVTNIGRYAFQSTAYYNNEKNWADGALYINNHLIKANDISGSYEIRPGTLTIGGGAFYGCSGLTGISIPDSVATIGEFAFENCRGLTSVSIPDGVTTIGICAFSCCSSLTSVSIPDSVTTIGDYAFYSCMGLTSISIPGSVTYIGEDAFDSCTRLTSISIPDSVTTICNWTFDGCNSLISVSIPGSVTYIGEDAFNGCASLADVYYAGSEHDWKNIEIYYGNDDLLNAKIHYKSTGPDKTTEPEISVVVDGKSITFDVPPRIIDGTTMLPARLALEPLGADFAWDGAAQTVTIKANGKTIVLTIGADAALVDGAARPIIKPAVIIDGRTLIPIRFVAEELGYDVYWDDVSKMVAISEKQQFIFNDDTSTSREGTLKSGHKYIFRGTDELTYSIDERYREALEKRYFVKEKIFGVEFQGEETIETIAERIPSLLGPRVTAEDAALVISYDVGIKTLIFGFRDYMVTAGIGSKIIVNCEDGTIFLYRSCLF